MFKPTRKQIKTWYSMIADFGCVITGSSQIHIHHAVGRTYAKDDYQIGELFAYNLYSLPEYNITDHRKAFLKEHGVESEREFFFGMVDKMVDNCLEIPFEQVFLDKIQLVDR